MIMIITVKPTAVSVIVKQQMKMICMDKHYEMYRK